MIIDDEKILKIAKEVVIKFIEQGRISPSNFENHFNEIFWAVKRTIINGCVQMMEDGDEPAESPKNQSGKKK